MTYAAPPSRTALNDVYPLPSNATFKTGIGALWDMITGLLGATGNPEDAHSALKLLDPKAVRNLSPLFTFGANAMTITVKDAAAADLSASNPGFVAMRSSTLTSGVFNQRKLTANLSLVVSSGSVLGQISSDPGYLHLYLIDNAGTVELAISKAFFGQTGIVSTTAEGGAGAADSSTVMYSTSARASVPFRWFARIIAPQATAGTWTTSPTTVDMGPFSAPPGYELISFSSPSAVGSVDFTSGIDSNYDKYLIVINKLIPGTNATQPLLQVSENAGVSWKTGASDYEVGRILWGSVTAVTTSQAANATAASVMGAVASSTEGLSGEIVIFAPSSTGTKKAIRGDLSNYSSGGEMLGNITAAAYKGTTNPINGFRIIMNSGTIASCVSIALYGAKKSW